MDLSKYDYKKIVTTHYLNCKHCSGGKNQPPFYYVMKCLILGITKSGKYKIVVYGDRYHHNTEHIKKIRYVDKNRLWEQRPEYKPTLTKYYA